MSAQPKQKRSWPEKFGHAVRGVLIAVRGQSSFVIHVVATVLVIVAGVLLRISSIEWCLLVLSIAVVMAAELLNSGIERLAAAVTGEFDERIRDALDLAAGAVLLTALGAAVVGGIVFVNRILVLFS